MLLFLILSVLPVYSVRKDFTSLQDYFENSLFTPREENHHNIIDYDFHHPQLQNLQYPEHVPVQRPQLIGDKFANILAYPDFFGVKKKVKKKKLKKKYKYFLPFLLTAIAKLAHFIPIVKLILLALFALVLFAKKAFLVSVGSFLLVLYDTFYKKNSSNGWLHRNQPSKQDDFPDTNKDDWWETNDNQTAKINPREEDKWKRWWKYYEQ